LSQIFALVEAARECEVLRGFFGPGCWESLEAAETFVCVACADGAALGLAPMLFEVASLNKLILLTTTNYHAARQAELDRLFNSIAAFRDAPRACPLTHYVLLQQFEEAQSAAFARSAPAFVVPLAVPAALSLSAARNILLERAKEDLSLSGEGVVAFPDDDCWYPDGFLHALANIFADPSLDMFVCGYGLEPVALDATQSKQAGFSGVTGCVSSNSMFLRAKLVRALGQFDEGIGVGTANNGGEDLEYALRALSTSRRALCNPRALVGHPGRDRIRRAKYYAGGLIAIGLHATASPGAVVAFIRKLLVGAALVGLGELKLSRYLSAVRATAARVWRSSRSRPPKYHRCDPA
jgi:hypothetical protein